MAGIAYVEGRYIPIEEARMSILDLGFLRGDAVYDTVSVWKGNFFRLDDHMTRFQASCASMRLDCPVEAPALKRVLGECVHRAGLEDAAYVQMITTRGRFPSLTNRDLRLTTPTFMAYSLPYIWIVSPEKQETGVHVAIVDNRRTPTEAIDPRVKNFNWMDMQRGLLQALDRAADFALLLTPEGYLSEGPGFNLFLIKDHIIYTPKRNVLEGITRRSVAELAGEIGRECRFADLEADALHEADEAFLSSTAGGIMPVTMVDGRTLGNGAPGLLTSQLKSLYWKKREAGWHGTPVASLVGATVN